MNHLVALVCFLIYAFLGSDASVPLKGDSLKLLIKNTSSSRSPIIVVAYAEEEHFLNEKGKKLTGQQIRKNDTLEFVVDKLDPGVYALVVFEDLNENGVLDQNKLGIPQEPLGFSKAKIGLFGPPSFKKASFEFPAENYIEVQLKSF